MTGIAPEWPINKPQKTNIMKPIGPPLILSGQVKQLPSSRQGESPNEAKPPANGPVTPGEN